MVEICPPVTIYGVFMAALVLFDLYTSRGRVAMHNIAYGILGSIFLFVLCAAGMEFVAWGLLLLPIIFYLFLLAVIVFDRSSLLSVTHTYNKRTPAIVPTSGGQSCDESSCDPEPTCETSDC